MGKKLIALETKRLPLYERETTKGRRNRHSSSDMLADEIQRRSSSADNLAAGTTDKEILNYYEEERPSLKKTVYIPKSKKNDEWNPSEVITTRKRNSVPSILLKNIAMLEIQEAGRVTDGVE